MSDTKTEMDPTLFKILAGITGDRLISFKWRIHDIYTILELEVEKFPTLVVNGEPQTKIEKLSFAIVDRKIKLH